VENVNERKNHLENLLEIITKCDEFTDANFQMLQGKVEEELARETKRLPDVRKNPYLHNLKNTIEKQVIDYNEAIPNYKHVEYFRFIKAFRENIKDELTRMKKYA
jgi:hypothetical protein